MGRLEAREPRVAAAVRAMEGALDRPLSTRRWRGGRACRCGGWRCCSAARWAPRPGAYYAGLRLSAARRLVTDTALPLGEVALRTGFGSLSAFSRSFRRHTGTTAREARAAARTARARPGGRET
jgi:transcriptional regulator GlxA family with amidase domain